VVLGPGLGYEDLDAGISKNNTRDRICVAGSAGEHKPGRQSRILLESAPRRAYPMGEGPECRIDLLRGSLESSDCHGPQISLKKRLDAQTPARDCCLDGLGVELVLLRVRPCVRSTDPLRMDETRRGKGDAARLKTVGGHIL
jgi:hypothetical protein